MRVAIVHDWLKTYAGSERVLEQMLLVYPEADLFSVVDFVPKNERAFIQNKQVTTTFIQKLPFAKNKFRLFLPLMPLAIEQLDVSCYDLVISSSHAVAKGVITGPGQLHICMCYSPIRYAWDLQHQYLHETGLNHGMKGAIAKYLLHRMRLWDVRTAHGVDHFIAISQFIAKRIRKVYGRDSTVIYPPVDISGFSFEDQKQEFYLTASRMVPYKKIDLIVDAFSKMPEKKLVVIGDGPDYNKIRKKVSNNITLLGFQPFNVLKDYMQRAKAFVFAAKEDFGIAPLEAQACGTPVIGLGSGGLLETIKGSSHDEPTGCFFMEQTEESIIEAVEYFERLQKKIDLQECRSNAARFSSERFRQEFRAFIDSKV
ncbi:MAG: glycosyltransferase family 4 protein [Chlamydiales bacterium]|nr:glycosyltransferase family 4 protein [Chlamydiales bacterium]